MAFRYKIFLPIVLLSGLILGLNFTGNYLLQKHEFAKFVGENIEIQGIVIEDIDKKEDGNLSAKIAVKSANNTKINGRIFANFKSKSEIRRSDEIIISGEMSEGFGNFGGSLFRANVLKIQPSADFVRDIRDNFAAKVRENINSPEVDLGLGYLLGQKNSLPAELEKALKTVALTHVIVASGYNLTILVMSFVVMVGFAPSMMRAGIVSLIGLITWYFGRKIKPLFVLTFVAAITILIFPGNIFDLGWQLSFASFFGVMILSPLLQKFLFKEPDKLSSFFQIFFETLSAQILTIPIVLFGFSVFSPISILANLAILPFVPAAMFFTFLTGIFSFIFAPFAQIFGFLSSLILKYSVYAVEFFAKSPAAQFELNISIFSLIIFYIMIFFVCGFLKWRTEEDKTRLELVD